MNRATTLALAAIATGAAAPSLAHAQLLEFTCHVRSNEAVAGDAFGIRIVFDPTQPPALVDGVKSIFAAQSAEVYSYQASGPHTPFDLGFGDDPFETHGFVPEFFQIQFVNDASEGLQFIYVDDDLPIFMAGFQIHAPVGIVPMTPVLSLPTDPADYDPGPYVNDLGQNVIQLSARTTLNSVIVWDDLNGYDTPGNWFTYEVRVVEPACFADCDENGSLNVDDIDCFVASFLAGCP